MKHIHLTRIFAVLAFAGVVASIAHVAKANDKTPVPAYSATASSGATVTLTMAHGKCGDDLLQATYVAPKEDAVSGCWKPINKYQVLVLWDDGEVVAYNTSMFTADKAA